MNYVMRRQALRGFSCLVLFGVGDARQSGDKAALGRN